MQLTAAFRSLSRPSSAPNAKAFSICSSSLELPSAVCSCLFWFSLLCKNCCAHTFALLMAKLCLFPLLFRKNLISRGSPLFLHVSLTLSVMYVSHAFFRIHMIRYFLIRFSMNIRPFGFHEHLNLHSGARQIRTELGSSGLEPPTSRLSGARSNQLSYEPIGFPASLRDCPACWR